MVRKSEDEKHNGRETDIDNIEGLADIEKFQEMLSNEVINKSGEHVSFYELVKEIAEEEGLSFVSGGIVKDVDAFESYRATRLRYFKEVLKKLGRLETFQTKKGEPYQIPLQAKEPIKFLVRNFSEPLNRKIRQGKEDSITVKEIESFNERSQTTGFSQLTDEEKKEKTALIASLTQMASQKAFATVNSSLEKMWQDDLRSLSYVSGKIGD